MPRLRQSQPRLAWAATQVDLVDAAVRHYGYERAEAAEHFTDVAATIQTNWRDALASEGMPAAEVDRYEGTFSPLA